jgi:glucokinase
MRRESDMFLCCDVGGTVCGWGLYDTQRREIVHDREEKIAEFEDFYDLFDHILVEIDKLSEPDGKITNTTIAVAGIVDFRRARITNINWEVNLDGIEARLKQHKHSQFASLINDFEALGYGVLSKKEIGFCDDDYEEIHGRYKSRRAREEEDRSFRSLVCGPGTGLGIACIVDGLMKDGFPYIFSSEGGHHWLAPETNAQLRLLVNKQTGELLPKSYEDVLSHTGLCNIYNEIAWSDYNQAKDHEITPYKILVLAEEGRDPAAIDARDEVLASFCGNSVLMFNSYDAVYLWGGVLMQLPHGLLKSHFKHQFERRRKHGGRVNMVPVVRLLNPMIPLLGCAHRSEFEIKHLAPGDPRHG